MKKYEQVIQMLNDVQDCIPSTDSEALILFDRLINNLEAMQVPNLSLKEIFQQFDSLEKLGEYLDTSAESDKYGYASETMQTILDVLCEQSFLTIWALWQYFNGHEYEKQTYLPAYESVMKVVKKISLEIAKL